MTDSAWGFVNLVIVSTLISLVTKEVNVLNVIDELQGISLIPSYGEDIKGDLTSNGEGKVIVCKLILQDSDKLFPNVSVLVILLEFTALLLGTVTSDWGYVEHALAEFDEGASLDGDVEICYIAKDEVNERLQTVLAQIGGDGGLGDELFAFVCDKPVLRKCVVEHVKNGVAKLFLLLPEVGTADHTDYELGAQLFEKGEHFRGGGLWWKLVERQFEIEMA